MLKTIVIGLWGMFLLVGPAEAACSWSTLANGNTADANQVMNDINCLAPLANPSFTGNIGIGTTTPNAKLEVSNGALMAGDGAGVVLTGRYSSVYPNGGTTGYFQLATNNLDAINGGLSIKTLTAGTLTEKMRIDKSGLVGIGTTTPSYTLQVNGSVAGASAYTNLSDERLKKDVQPIQNALQIIEKIHGISFRWRKPAERSVGRKFDLPISEPQVGFIAQDLGKILPQAVSIAKGKDAIMSVAESKVVPVLVEAVKQLKAANDQQAAAIREMRIQISALQRKTGVQTARN